MGNKQSVKEKIKTEVMNNTNIQTKLKKVNDTMNKTVIDVINKTSEEMEVNSKTSLKQDVGGFKLKGLKNVKDTSIKVGQKLDQEDTIKITAISDVEQSADVINDIQKQISNDLQKSLSAQQEQSKSEGEQMMKELMGAITDVVGNAMQY